MRFVVRLGIDSVPVVIEYSYTPEMPEKINGPMEDCYPAEAAEVHIESATIGGKRVWQLLSPEYKQHIDNEALLHALDSADDYSAKKSDHERAQREEF